MNREIRDESLPRGWKKMRIIDFSPLQRGYDLPSSKIEKGTYPVVYSNGINNYHSKFKVVAPGVVTGRSGTIGKVTYVETNYWPHNTSLWVTDFKGNFPKFVFYALERLRLEKYDAGSGVPTLNRNDVHKQFILVPPLAEQKAIASLLETWDTATEKTKALIAAKQKRFEWLLKTLIANNCSQWKHYKSMNLFESLSRRGYSNEQLLSATQDQGVVPRSTLEGRVMSPSGSIEGYKLVQPGDFTISLRSFQGGIEYSDYRGVISPAYTVLTPVREIVDDFYRYFFKSYIFVEKYLSLAVVGIREGKQINFDDFKTIKIPYPSLNHQLEIANTLNIARQEIDTLKQLTDKYHTQKRGLIQKLLTGKWKVNT